MAKSNRRRKLDRTKRQVRDSQRQVVAGRRQAKAKTIRDAITRWGLLVRPDAPVAELVSLLDEEHGGKPVSLWLLDRMLANAATPERLAEAAEAMLAFGHAEESAPSLTALTFAAGVARAEGNSGRARELLDQALEIAVDDPEHRFGLVEHLQRSGRLADGILLLEATLRDAPGDHQAAERYGVAIQEAHERLNHEQPSGPCPCGRNASWQECCGPRERAALSRFTDRSLMTAMSDAVAAFLTSSAYGRAIDDEVAAFVAALDDLDWEPDELASFRALLAEHALLSAKLPTDNLGNEDDQDEGDAAGPLGAFAADPSVPRELAAQADSWRTHIRYGLWRIDDQSAAPGLWCTDLCSCVVRYAEFPAPLTGTWPRWSVWLGAMVPVDGVWRATGTGLRLSPAEGDAAAEYALAASARVLEAAAGKKKRSTRPAETIRFGDAEPIGVTVDGRDAVPSGIASVISIVVGHLLPRIAGEVHLDRWTPPALRNTDGDEMCLVTAEIAVNDSEQVSDRLAARAGFERDPNDPAHIIWYGIGIPGTQQKGMLAQAKAQLGARGLAPADLDESEGPQRWVRGTLRFSPGQIVAEVNSDERLARLLDVLAKIGAAPTVTEETRVEPAKELAWPGGESAHPRGATPSGEGWEKYWLDKQLPALGGRTPREATEGQELLILEALLRQFEYEADLLAARGQQGIDTDWLRKELDMTDEMAEEVPELSEQGR